MRLYHLPLLALLALPAAAEAQWTVTPQAGWIFFDDGTALRGMPAGGLELSRAAGPISAGFFVDYGRGEVDGSRFPAAQLDFGVDSTVNVNIDQPLSAMNYGIAVQAGFEAGALRPYLSGGVGGYSLFLNAQQWDRPETKSGLLFSVGGGARFEVADGASLVLDLRDLIYPGFDANELNVVREENRNDRFPELNPEPLEEGTAHNLRLTLGFSFIPGEGR